MTEKFDAKKIKNDFPIFSRTIKGKPLIYLDSAATTQKPKAVIDAISRFYSESNANIHRGVYWLAEEATDLYEQTRKNVAAFINSPTSSNIIFTRNTTESINLVAHSWARKFLKEGDEILITDLEHHANIVPWYLLGKERGIKIIPVKITEKLELDLDDFQNKLSPKVKLVAVTALSNVLGTIVPLEKIVELARANKSLVLVDGAQSVPHLTTDIQKMNPDFFAFSGHKMLGPTGVGVLWVQSKVLDTMDPFMGGGEMINKVTLEEITWNENPLKFEAGTSNFADVAAFSTSLDYLSKLGMENIHRHEKELSEYAIEKLSATPNIQLYIPADPAKRSGVVSFNHKVVHSHDVGTILSDQGVAVRVGHHCAQLLMKALNTSSTVRASFYIYNTKDDVDGLIKALAQVDRVFGL